MDRRRFLALAATGLAACSKPARRLTARPAPSSSPAPTAPAAPSTTAAPQHSGPATAVYNGPRTSDGVALTFHGSGEVGLTDQLLAEAARLQAPITVFAVGRWLDQNPTLGRRILDAGHELENHTYTHPTLSGASASVVASEVSKCRDVLAAQTGSAGRYFRPSGMEPRYPELVLDEAGTAGYGVVCGYDVDPLDYQDPGAAAIVSRVRAGVKPGSIVSLHLGHAGTVTAFPNLVAEIHARGLRPLLVRDLLAAV